MRWRVIRIVHVHGDSMEVRDSRHGIPRVQVTPVTVTVHSRSREDGSAGSSGLRGGCTLCHCNSKPVRDTIRITMDSPEGATHRPARINAGQLAVLPLFGGLPRDTLGELAALATRHTVSRAGQITSTDEHTEGATIVVDGWAGVGSSRTGTREILFLLAHPGDYLALSDIQAGPDDVVHAVAMFGPVVTITLPPLISGMRWRITRPWNMLSSCSAIVGLVK